MKPRKDKKTIKKERNGGREKGRNFTMRIKAVLLSGKDKGKGTSSLCVSVHGISQGRVLEWVAIPISRESSDRLFTSRVTRETRRSWHLEVIGTIFSREASMEEG